MTLQLDPPVSLELPGEQPAAVEELAAAVGSGAFHLGLLGAHLAGPAAAVRDWVGRDAAAAAAQVEVLGGLVRDQRAAVSAAAARLERHAAAVRDTVTRVGVLQAAQHEEFGTVVHRLAELTGTTPLGAAPSAAVAVLEEWRAAEARRARAHTALLAELADDATATGRALAACAAVVGATGEAGDDGRVLRHLAQVLPGWGTPELAGRARALAAALTGPVPAGRVDELAQEAADWVCAPAYADALLAGLGTDGVRWLLSVAGDDARGADGPVARALAGALGAARAGGPGADPAGVLTARYVERSDPDGAADVVVLGMAAVLAAGSRSPGGGPSSPVLVAWGAQVLARERAQQATAAQRVPRAQVAGDDPVELVVRSLARSQDPVAAARLLAAPDAFPTLLSRAWPSGTAELARLLSLAASAPGPEGDAAARAGLAALGEGLAPGSAGPWTVRPATAAALAPELARGLIAHPGVVTGLLRDAGSAGPPLPAADDTALRGLGCLTRHGAAAGALAELVAGRLRTAGGASGATAAEVGALVAVQDYGQRLDHALAAATARSRAIDRAVWWEVLLSPLRGAEELDEVPTGYQVPLDLAIDAVGHGLGVDGSWTVGPDRGAVLTRSTAATRAAAAVGGEPTGEAGEVAATAFDVALLRLGVPTGPSPEPWSWSQMVLDDLPAPDAVADGRQERLDALPDGEHHPNRLPHGSPVR